jgi:hypothetical protein
MGRAEYYSRIKVSHEERYRNKKSGKGRPLRGQLNIDRINQP